MFEEILIEQNPHWSEKAYPWSFPRACFEKLKSYLPLSHVISITGVRRSGKSTLLKQAITYLIEEEECSPRNILFCNLEHPYFAQYAGDVKYLEVLFQDFLKICEPKGHVYCCLDEIQFFSNWPVFVKSHYEQKNIKFLITGSNSFLMSHELLTLLSGRTLPIEVLPLSFSEFVHAKIGKPINSHFAFSEHKNTLRRLSSDYLQYGGFPEVALHIESNLAYEVLNAYAKTILYQDVATRLSVKKPLDLEKLFYYLTSHVGTLFSYAGLAKTFNLTDKTVKEYIQALIDANLLFELDKFSFSLKQQIRTGKKIYSIDPGLVNAVAFKFTDGLGKLFENVLYLECKRLGTEIYYYKTASNFEVDFLLKQGKEIRLIQVCTEAKGGKTQEREVRALVQAAQELDLQEGTIVTLEEEHKENIQGIEISWIPLYKFLSSC